MDWHLIQIRCRGFTPSFSVWRFLTSEICNKNINENQHKGRSGRREPGPAAVKQWHSFLCWKYVALFMPNTFRPATGLKIVCHWILLLCTNISTVITNVNVTQCHYLYIFSDPNICICIWSWTWPKPDAVPRRKFCSSSASAAAIKFKLPSIRSGLCTLQPV